MEIEDEENETENMSYESHYEVPNGISIELIKEILRLLGCKRIGKVKLPDGDIVEQFSWFETTYWKSRTGVDVYLLLEPGKSIWSVGTRTTSARSYWDLEQQNKTVKLLRELFGGEFSTDVGKNRLMYRRLGKPPPLAWNACLNIFERFGSHIVSSTVMVDEMPDLNEDTLNKLFGSIMSGSYPAKSELVIVHLVPILEDYFKTIFVALLQSSKNKSSIFKGLRIQP